MNAKFLCESYMYIYIICNMYIRICMYMYIVESSPTLAGDHLKNAGWWNSYPLLWIPSTHKQWLPHLWLQTPKNRAHPETQHVFPPRAPPRCNPLFGPANGPPSDEASVDAWTPQVWHDRHGHDWKTTPWELIDWL
jgi:hypothetical protein